MSDPAPGAVSVALLGYGAIAESHAVALQSLGARIAIVMGPNLEEAHRFADRFGVPQVTANLEAAVSDHSVDAVVIASPSRVHSDQAKAALDAGRHVLVEIPLALSLVRAQALVEQAHRAGRTLMVCHTLRYSPPYLAAKAYLADRSLWPRHVVARGLSRRRENVGWTGRRRSWTDNLLWHQGGHVVDAVLDLLGGPATEVMAVAGPRWDGSGLPMDYGFALRTADGGVGSIALSYNALLEATDFTVIAGEDTIVIAGDRVFSSHGPIFEDTAGGAILERAVATQDRDFLVSILTGRRPTAEASAILPALRVLQAVDDRVQNSSDSDDDSPALNSRPRGQTGY